VRRFLPQNGDRRDDNETDRAWCDVDTRTAADRQSLDNLVVQSAINVGSISSKQHDMQEFHLPGPGRALHSQST